MVFCEFHVSPVYSLHSHEDFFCGFCSKPDSNSVQEHRVLQDEIKPVRLASFDRHWNKTIIAVYTGAIEYNTMISNIIHSNLDDYDYFDDNMIG